MKHTIKKGRKRPGILLPRIIRKEASFVFVLPENINDKDGTGSIRILGACSPLFGHRVAFNATQRGFGLRASLDIGRHSLPLGELIPGVEYLLRFVLSRGMIEVQFGYKDSYRVTRSIYTGKTWFLWLLWPAMLGSYRMREDVSIKIFKVPKP
jgi:hypothetical protein